MKKRKDRHAEGGTPPPEKLDDLRNIRTLRPDDVFHFNCTCCGDCCRHVARSVMLEPYDLYRIAKALRQTGHAIQGIEDVIMEYAEIQTLGDVRYPVFMLKTRGPKDNMLFSVNVSEESSTIFSIPSNYSDFSVGLACCHGFRYTCYNPPVLHNGCECGTGLLCRQ